jgi:hypothetical protein
MRSTLLLPLILAPIALHSWACATSTGTRFSDEEETAGATSSGEGGGSTGGSGGQGGASVGTNGAGGSIFEEDGGIFTDASSEEPPLSDDAACAAVAEEATIEKLPVDIIWVVDNSASMAPAIEEIRKGLNAFAGLIEAKQLDYKVIMLSLRSKTSPVSVGGSKRYPVCIPAPLAGDDACGNGPRFFHSSVDIRSTQPLEQLLGTLGQTAGYAKGEEKGGDPWFQALRPEATKTIVVATDDNARLSATQFEQFPGGKDPFNSTTLPPGVLDPSWNDLFKDYIFSGIYGWGVEGDPSAVCLFADGTKPASSGPTYTTLVQKTGGVRAKLCDGSAAWQPFFNEIAKAVEKTAKLSCELTIPAPPSGEIDPQLVNVALVAGGSPTYLPQVADAAACGAPGGWYYDDPKAPKKITLCASSCDTAQGMIGPDKPGGIQVHFGCKTIIN